MAPRSRRLVAVAQRFNLLRQRVSHQFFSVTIFENESPEVIFRCLMTDLLKSDVNAAVENRTGYGNKYAKFFLSHNNTETVCNIGDETNHLGRFSLQDPAINHYSCRSRHELAGFSNGGDHRCFDG